MTGTLVVDGRSTSYSIQPGGAFISETSDDVRPVETGFGIVRAIEGGVPAASALVVSERRDQSIRSAHIVASNQEGTLLWGAVDTFPSILRHGDIEMVSQANLLQCSANQRSARRAGLGNHQ